MRHAAILAIFAVSLICGGSRENERLEVRALENEVRRIAEESSLWPGFDPLGMPFAVFDGTNTYVFRHPGALDGFTRQEGMLVFPGRHPAVIANSSASIGGIAMATIILDGPIEKEALRDRTALVIHEGFHVFQGTTGRQWGADESQLFMYPTDDADLLALRRLETEALRRACDTRDSTAAAGLAVQALELRRERFGRMDPVFGAYERGIEAQEGTATYVEFMAAGRLGPQIPKSGFPPEAVRLRAYRTGLAWALLLDRFRAGWREGFADDGSRYLDSDLEEVLRRVERPAARAFSALERASARDAAQEDAAKLRAARAQMQKRIESAPGWRLIVEANPGAPLWPQGFDPMNVRRLDSGLLHTRFLKLGNDAGTLEVMGDTALTEGVGPHPMFNGIKRVTIVGFAAEPEIAIDADTVVIALPTVHARLHGAAVEKTDRRITVRLGRTLK